MSRSPSRTIVKTKLMIGELHPLFSRPMLDSIGTLRWVKWGLLREHANGHMGTLMNFSVTSFQVLRSINIPAARFLTNSFAAVVF
jgi:hypothetical protein